MIADPIKLKPSANEWSCIQNNNNNEYYLDLATGSYNNNNKNNPYWVVPVELEELCELVFRAEADCWKNKHSSWDANKYHTHTGRRIFEFIRALANRTYQPWKSYCFVIMYPKPREIFAAHYQDRIAHHIAAPYLTAVSECVHNLNGNVSFGNRKMRSSYHACLRVQEMMRKHPQGYVLTIDLQGYFMSIDRQIAWEVFCDYESKHTPIGYTQEQRAFYMWLIELLIKHDPSVNCERRSPLHLWSDHIKPNKSLFGNTGKGLPIGNYYSQIIANLIPERLCEATKEYDITEFVDDFAVVVDTAQDAARVEAIFDAELEKLHLERNKRKRYLQPVMHGVLWCGHFIYANRLYTINRTVHNCERKVSKAIERPSLHRARKLQQVINSYFGMMMHTAEYKTQKRIVQKILNSEYSKWMYFKEEPHHFICKIRKEFSRAAMSEKDIQEIENNLKASIYDSNAN